MTSLDIATITAALITTFGVIIAAWIKCRDVKKQDNIDSKIIDSIFTLYQPDSSLSEPQSATIKRNYDRLSKEIEALHSNEDWDSIVRVKVHLREYFEYSGQYKQGASFGRFYVTALREISPEKKQEVLWARIKNIGYFLILAGEHDTGRRELETVLAELEERYNSCPSSSLAECLFYCHRYLGISLQRDTNISGVSHALMHFRLAEKKSKEIEDTEKHKELMARLQGNYGNIALEKKDYAAALEHYKDSLELFTDLEDAEHIGIAKLKLAEYYIKVESQYGEAEKLLDSASDIFTDIGWIEGLARVDEQRTLLIIVQYLKIFQTQNKELFRKKCKEAINYGSRAFSLYTSLQVNVGTQRIKGLLTNLRIMCKC